MPRAKLNRIVYIMVSSSNNKKSTAETDKKVSQAIRYQINANMAHLSIDELWQVLEVVNRKSLGVSVTEKIEMDNPIPNKAIIKRNTVKRNTVKYISVDDSTAASLIYTYLMSIEDNKDNSRNTIKINKAFHGNIANPTHANRRLLYSYFFRNECKVANSVPAEVAEAYKAQPLILDKVQRKFVDNYLNNNPEFAIKLRSYKDSHYLRSVVA